MCPLFQIRACPTLIFTFTTRAYIWHLHRITTVVAREVVHILMIRQRDVTVWTLWNPPALSTFHHRCKATSILKQYCLFATPQRLTNSRKKTWREGPSHHLSTIKILDINNFYFRKLNIFITTHQLNKAILTLFRIVIAFHRGCSCSQKCLCIRIHLCQHNRCRASMITRSRVLLLKTLLMFFIYNDKT